MSDSELSLFLIERINHCEYLYGWKGKPPSLNIPHAKESRIKGFRAVMDYIQDNPIESLAVFINDSIKELEERKKYLLWQNEEPFIINSLRQVLNFINKES